jgi:tRNA-Thr(GGU) m(6)t(6)A37 methyltransferase TsaA
MDDAFEIVPIGVVRGGRTEATDDDWGQSVATIELDGDRFTTDVVAGLDEFSHLEVIYLFDRVDESAVNLGARHPRGRSDWPLVGILAQRAKARPNRLGVTVCEIVAVDGLDIVVRGLDAIDGTPVIDIKPYMTEFAPRTPTRQPVWSTELMRGYW